MAIRSEARDGAVGSQQATTSSRPFNMGPMSRRSSRMPLVARVATALALSVVVAALPLPGSAQGDRDAPVRKPSALPNPYRLVPDWPTLPATMKGPNGHKWGEVIRVHVGANGHVWVFHRCFY